MQAGYDRQMSASSDASGLTRSRRSGLWVMAAVAAGVSVFAGNVGAIKPAHTVGLNAPHLHQDPSRHSHPVTIAAIFPF